MYSNTQNRSRERPNGLMLCTPWSLITTISPGSTSRTKSAPTISSAQVSRGQHPAAGALAMPMRPRISGRTPSGSRTPISASVDSATSE